MDKKRLVKELVSAADGGNDRSCVSHGDKLTERSNVDAVFRRFASAAKRRGRLASVFGVGRRSLESFSKLSSSPSLSSLGSNLMYDGSGKEGIEVSRQVLLKRRPTPVTEFD